MRAQGVWLKAFACFESMFTHYSGPAPASCSFYVPSFGEGGSRGLASKLELWIMNAWLIKRTSSRQGKWWLRHANHPASGSQHPVDAVGGVSGRNANAFLAALDWIFSQHSNDAAERRRTQTTWSDELKQSRKAQSAGLAKREPGGGVSLSSLWERSRKAKTPTHCPNPRTRTAAPWLGPLAT